ncbi:MAG: arylsulfatase [Tannerella sp.]|jgi:arylsulfatase A-like enzyme|nr:arylsulfatase [Tannerella sp.]
MKRRAFIKASIGTGLGLNTINLLSQETRSRPIDTPHSAPLKNENKATTSKKPHIIFIMTDQHRADTLGCMGNRSVISPNIDSLAREGTLFLSGYSSSPSSTPARSGLLTGLSPWHHGMLGYGRVAQQYKYEMPQMMSNLGYYTFGIGKMHWFPQKSLHGFQTTLIDESGRTESPDFISDYREWFQLQSPGADPDLTGIGWNDHRAGVYQLDEKLHPTTWTGQKACELIRNYSNEKPLFLKVSFARPHSPYDPPQRYLEMYKDAEIPAPFIGDWCSNLSERLDPEKAKPDAPFGNFGAEYAQNSRRHYYANITFIDDQIGAIIQTLKEKGMYDNAIICFTSDHGDMLGDHYHWRKTYPYEGSAAIPYIVKWPENIQQEKDTSVITQPVELRDFLPTFIDLAGGNIPSDMDGMSLLKLVQGKQEEWRTYIDMEHATCYSADNYWCALTDGKIKYIWNFHNGSEQLFDLEKDPKELTECSKHKKYAKTVEKMRQAMVDHLSERGDSFVKDGQLVVRTSTLLYSPNYPENVPNK